MDFSIPTNNKVNVKAGEQTGQLHESYERVEKVVEYESDGMEQPNQDKIRTLAENETYKYLGILEADTIKQVEMKDKIQKEYLRRTIKLLETKLSSQNLIKGINTWAVPFVRYSGPFLKWTRDELKQMDQTTKKLITMH